MSEPASTGVSRDRRAHVHIAQRIDSSAVADLRRRCQVTLGFGYGAVALERVIGDIDGLVVRAMPVGNDLLDAAGRLRVIVRAGIGLEGIDLVHARKLGIVVRNTPGTNARSVAEHTLALALAASRGILDWDSLTRRGQAARRDEAPARELYRGTWGVVGFGHIGREVAAIARDGLGMRVVTCPRPGSAVEVPGVSAVPDLDTLLAASDVVSLHVPLTEATAGMIGAQEIARMRPSAVLVNVARGAVVDTGALLRALSERRILAAAVDVWDGPFPTPPDRLYDTPHLVLSPHRAGRTVQADLAAGAAVVRELLAVLEEIADC